MDRVSSGSIQGRPLQRIGRVMKAVILAGGKGTRLKPYTTHFPKPLMPVGDRPILEIIVDQLRKADFSEIIITTGHLEEMVRAFFGDGGKFGITLSYSKEDQPLGTAGPLNLIRDQLTETFLLMNGDVLTDMDFPAMIEYHKSRKATATISLTQRKVDIDYGVVEVDEDLIFTRWKEKPTIQYLVSMGIYLLEPESLTYMPVSGFFNLPDLIVKLKAEQKTVAGYLHKGHWLDIGRPDDYETACEGLENGTLIF